MFILELISFFKEFCNIWNSISTQYAAPIFLHKQVWVMFLYKKTDGILAMHKHVKCYNISFVYDWKTSTKIVPKTSLSVMCSDKLLSFRAFTFFLIHAVIKKGEIICTLRQLFCSANQIVNFNYIVYYGLYKTDCLITNMINKSDMMRGDSSGRLGRDSNMHSGWTTRKSRIIDG